MRRHSRLINLHMTMTYSSRLLNSLRRVSNYVVADVSQAPEKKAKQPTPSLSEFRPPSEHTTRTFAAVTATTPYYAVDIDGALFYEPLRSILYNAANERNLQSAMWLTDNDVRPEVLQAAGLSIRKNAKPVEIPLSLLQQQQQKYCLWSVDDLVIDENGTEHPLPPNVEPRCLIARSASPGAFNYTSHLMRSVVGMYFSSAFSNAMGCHMNHMRGSPSSYSSKCWVSTSDMAFLGWTPLPDAQPLSVRKSLHTASERRTQEDHLIEEGVEEGGASSLALVDKDSIVYYNAQDIANKIDFSEYFFRVRAARNVLTGQSYPGSISLRLSQHTVGIGLEDFSGAPLVVGTEDDFAKATNSTATVLPSAAPFQRVVSSVGVLAPLYVAQQTSNVAAALLAGRRSAHIVRQHQDEKAKAA